MSGLIKGLTKYLFMIVFVTLIIFLIGYFYRDKTRPIEKFVQENVLTYIISDTTGQGLAVDTVLTPEEELAIQIDERQNQLTVRSATLDSIELAVNTRMDSIQTIRNQLLELETALTQQESDNLDRLAKVYEAMKPDEASVILLQLNDAAIAEIISRMKDRQAGKLMGVIDPVRAADITNRLRRIRRQD